MALVKKLLKPGKRISDRNTGYYLLGMMKPFFCNTDTVVRQLGDRLTDCWLLLSLTSSFINSTTNKLVERALLNCNAISNLVSFLQETFI